MLQMIRIFRLKRTLSYLNNRRDPLRFIKIFRLGSILSHLIGATVVLLVVLAVLLVLLVPVVLLVLLVLLVPVVPVVLLVSDEEPDAAYDTDETESLYAASTAITSVDNHSTKSAVPKGGTATGAHAGAARSGDYFPVPSRRAAQLVANQASERAILYILAFPRRRRGDHFPAPAPD
jgi:hypothetical protein